MIVGLPNRVINEICAELLNNQDFAKFVYYKDKECDILSLPDIENPHKLLKNKQVHVNRKIPKVLEAYDVNVFMNLSRWTSYQKFGAHQSQTISEVTIKVSVLVQASTLPTENGNRDIALVSIIKDVLEKSDLSGVGKCHVEDVRELYGLPPEFHGFEMYCKVDGFKHLKVTV